MILEGKTLGSDGKYTVLKDLNLFKKYTKNQETSHNFKLGLTLSNRPHFNSVYLVRVPFLTGIAVYAPIIIRFGKKSIVYRNLFDK